MERIDQQNAFRETHWWSQFGHLEIQTARKLLAQSSEHWQNGDSDGELEQYASFTMIPSEKNITVKIALDVSFGKSDHISDTFPCEQFDLVFELLEKIRKTTLFHVHNRARYYRELMDPSLMDTNSPAAHFCNSMCIKLDEIEQKVLALVLADSAARTTLTVHVATAGVFMKTSRLWNAQ